MAKPTLTAAGHGMIGHHFLEQCVSRNLHLHYHIVVFGEERYVTYDRAYLLEYFARRSTQSLSLVVDDLFARGDIELRLGRCMTEINRGMRVIHNTDRHETHWDSLMSATGSYPFVPPIKDGGLPVCFAYHASDDLDTITAEVKSVCRGVVIGGGPPDLEAANVLRQLKLGTHVAEFIINLMTM